MGVLEDLRFANVGTQLPARIQKGYRRCRYCSTKAKEKKTNVMCTECSVPLCAVPCFKLFHVKHVLYINIYILSLFYLLIISCNKTVK